MTKELLQQALDALDSPMIKTHSALRKEIRMALAAPQPEPVAEVVERKHQPWEHGKHTSWLVNPSDLSAGTRLYAAPPAAPAPVDPTMTREELVAAAESIGMRMPATVVPDPWRMAVDAAMVGHALDCTTPDSDPKQCVELLCKQVADIWRDIAAPVVREPLTQDAIVGLATNYEERYHRWVFICVDELEQFARAIEKAHGIGGGK